MQIRLRLLGQSDPRLELARQAQDNNASAHMYVVVLSSFDGQYVIIEYRC